MVRCPILRRKDSLRVFNCRTVNPQIADACSAVRSLSSIGAGSASTTGAVSRARANACSRESSPMSRGSDSRGPSVIARSNVRDRHIVLSRAGFPGDPVT